MSERDDAELIRDVCGGDVDVFENLVVRHGQAVSSVVARHVPHNEVEAVSHDVWLRAFKSLHTYSGRAQFKTWLSRIAARECYDYWRRRYRSRESTFADCAPDGAADWVEQVTAAASTEAYARAVAGAAAREILQWALARLSAADRMVVSLVHLEGLSVADSATALGWTRVNVKVRSMRARRRLRRIIEELEDQP